MSTIPSASPRPSISSIQSATTDTTAPVTTSDRTAARRNKAAALRDYYNLRNTQPPVPPSPSNTSTVNLEDLHEPSKLDAPNFSPTTYVSDLLSREGIEGVVKVEAGLLSEIRTLDGEKKALVYDNYSKLITATETIRKMREKMDPLTPTTRTLTPAIGHIAESAEGLAGEMRRGVVGVSDEERKREKERQTVRWVTAAPERLRGLREEGKGEEAQREWKIVEGMLDKWSGVRGVDDVRRKCLEALEKGDGSDNG